MQFLIYEIPRLHTPMKRPFPWRTDSNETLFAISYLYCPPLLVFEFLIFERPIYLWILLNRMCVPPIVYGLLRVRPFHLAIGGHFKSYCLKVLLSHHAFFFTEVHILILWVPDAAYHLSVALFFRAHCVDHLPVIRHEPP